MSTSFTANQDTAGGRIAEIAARMDRLPPSWHVWRMIVLLSLGGMFEFYDLFFTGYVAPGMVKSGLFTPASLGPLAALKVIAVAGFGIFVFATFAGLWVGALIVSQVADRLGRRRSSPGRWCGTWCARPSWPSRPPACG